MYISSTEHLVYRSLNKSSDSKIDEKISAPSSKLISSCIRKDSTVSSNLYVTF